MKRMVVLLCALLGACVAHPDGPQVEPAAAADPQGKVVPITREGDWGVPCLIVEVGQTVEWRNFAPDVPINVTSLTEPAELYSPTLVAPYPNTGKDSKGNPYIWWRHTFAKPGIYEYFDAVSGEPGKKVVDPYYGKVTFVGLSPNLKTGVVCVKEPGSPLCRGVCCVANSDGDNTLAEDECPEDQCCDGEAKRCRTGNPSLQVCAGKLAYRQFQCLADADCPATEDGKTQACHIGPQFNHSCQLP